MDFIPFEIYNYEIWGYACLVVLATVLIVVSVRRRRALSHWLADNALDAEQEEALPLPGLSVIVLTDGCDSDALANVVPAIMEQNYPDFEVIVVNTDKSEAVDDELMRMQIAYPKLRSTFIPISSTNVSKRKLGITLGVKAATRDIVVITSAKCMPQSPLWLRAMGRHFDDYTDVVIGFAHNCHADDTAAGHRYRAYDQTIDASRYLAAAIHGCTYRANAYNVAYKRTSFFKMRGFASTLNLKYGDDDIFISQMADGDNVAVELSPESILEEHHSEDYANYVRLDRQHHFFTQRFTPSHVPGIRLLNAVGYYAFTLLSLAAVAYPVALYLQGDPMQFIKPAVLASIAVAVYLAETLVHIFAVRRIARVLQAPRPFFCIPPFRFVRPIINAKLSARASQAKNYTWE